jgi:hypothetical protein
MQPNPVGLGGAGNSGQDLLTTHVQAGETSLQQVAERLKMLLDLLQKFNPQIREPNKLVAGQEVRYPANPGTAPESGGTSAASTGETNRRSLESRLESTLARQRLEGLQTNAPAVPSGTPTVTTRTQNDDLGNTLGTREKIMANHKPFGNVDPWQKNVIGRMRDAATGGMTTFNYTQAGPNPSFVTMEAASFLAQKYGGKVIADPNSPYGGEGLILIDFGNGNTIKAGDIAYKLASGETEDYIRNFIASCAPKLDSRGQ